MKNLFLFVFLAVIFVFASVHAQESDDSDSDVTKDLETSQDFFSMLYSGSEVAAPQGPGGESYKRCLVVRCPIKCIICICRCVKWG